MSVIVLDGQLKSALAIVRSLGKKGVYVSCGAVRITSLSLHSTYTKHAFTYTNPKQDRVAFVQDLIAEAKRIYAETNTRPVLFCCSDATYTVCTSARQLLSQYVVFDAPLTTSIETTASKEKTYALAQRLSIPTIRTYTEAEFDDVTFPAVVKYAESILFNDAGSVEGSACYVFTLEELRKTYAQIKNETGNPPLVMQFIKGAEFGCEMVCDNGEPIAVFMHKRIRSLSPRGGAAVVKETAPQDTLTQQMESYARALVKELAWQGPCMVEFKVDTTTGSVYLMEINGRFWGSLPLAVIAGVDFPYMAYALARGESVEKKESAPLMVRTRHFLGDCKWLMAVLFAHDPLRSTLYPSRVHAFIDFKLEVFRSVGDIWVWNDPISSLFEYIDILHRIIWK